MTLRCDDDSHYDSDDSSGQNDVVVKPNTTNILLPVAININGSRSRPRVRARAGWAVSQTSLPWDTQEPDAPDGLQVKFEGCPLLQVTNIVMLQPMDRSGMDQVNTLYWDSATFKHRNFTTTWWLKPQIAPGMRVSSRCNGVQSHDQDYTTTSFRGLG